ncbi:MAG TPA: divergent polysaccharide deacetylase family protein [Bacteroidetes bacterium]|nr:divergent polysaccharide deacetylase family protein [Bacteroidota bacterium]
MLLLITFLNGAGVGFYLTRTLPPERAHPPEPPVAVNWDDVTEGLKQVFAENQVPESWLIRPVMSESDTNEVRSLKIGVKYPIHFLKDRLTNGLFQKLSEMGWTISEAEASLKYPNEDFVYKKGPNNLLEIQLIRYPKLEWLDRSIAIIIDDFGYKLHPVVDQFLKLPVPVTWAIIPGLNYTKEIAQIAGANHVPVIIHLPMEPMHARVEHGGFTIFEGMSKKNIGRVIHRALAEIPAAAGVNNHMGSKLSIYQPTLILFMQVLRDNGLFFIDSMTNPKSIAYKVARNQGVPSLKMFTYLDNPKSSLNLAQKLSEAVAESEKKGRAIVIGHARNETAALLKTEIKKWQARGIYFVPVSELVQEYEAKKLFRRKIAGRF